MNEKFEKVMVLFNKARKDYSASKTLLESDVFEYHSEVYCFAT